MATQAYVAPQSEPHQRTRTSSTESQQQQVSYFTDEDGHTAAVDMAGYAYTPTFITTASANGAFIFTRPSMYRQDSDPYVSKLKLAPYDPPQFSYSAYLDHGGSDGDEPFANNGHGRRPSTHDGRTMHSSFGGWDQPGGELGGHFWHQREGSGERSGGKVYARSEVAASPVIRLEPAWEPAETKPFYTPQGGLAMARSTSTSHDSSSSSNWSDSEEAHSYGFSYPPSQYSGSELSLAGAATSAACDPSAIHHSPTSPPTQHVLTPRDGARVPHVYGAMITSTPETPEINNISRHLLFGQPPSPYKMAEYAAGERLHRDMGHLGLSSTIKASPKTARAAATLAGVQREPSPAAASNDDDDSAGEDSDWSPEHERRGTIRGLSKLSRPGTLKRKVRSSASLQNVRQSTVKARVATTIYHPSPVAMLAPSVLAATSSVKRRSGRLALVFQGSTAPVLPPEEVMAQLPTKKCRGRRPPVSPELGLGLPGADGEDPNLNPSAAQIEYCGVTKTGKPKKVFVCRVPSCGKCFKRSEHLKRHVRSIHTYEKPFQCAWQDCGKFFSRHDNLSQHLRIHRAPNLSDEAFSAQIKEAFDKAVVERITNSAAAGEASGGDYE